MTRKNLIIGLIACLLMTYVIVINLKMSTMPIQRASQSGELVVFHQQKCAEYAKSVLGEGKHTILTPDQFQVFRDKLNDCIQKAHLEVKK